MYKKTCLVFFMIHFVHLFFPLMNGLIYLEMDQDIHNEIKNEENCVGFLYTSNIEKNFEAFRLAHISYFCRVEERGMIL